jgi:alpha-glucosidase
MLRGRMSRIASNRTPWWQTAVLYQIYPRSFQDTNGDGIGDLAGIIQRLPYLIDLGVNAVWLSPIFPSPMADFGYDISNYTDVDPRFGSMADLDRLIEAAHANGLKVLLDLVPNHTSDQHPWFQASRSARQNPMRDWYIWRDGAPGGPPTNWLSEFGGSAWEKDEVTGQYYYHAFLKQQPDLNWRNGEVRRAIYDVMRFWLARGVDGFRVDVIWHLIKDDQFRDNPPNSEFVAGQPPNRRLIPLYTADRPEVHDVIAEMREVVDQFPDRVLIGEIYLPIERLVAYYGRDLRGAHLPFNFSLLKARWNAPALAKLIDEYEAALPRGGWPNWVLGNHDTSRIASRIGPEQAGLAAMLMLTLRGTPTLYYGDEIGMMQVPIPPERVQDPFEKNVPGIGIGRDGCRAPMQWGPGPYAEFSDREPWLPIADDFRSRNVMTAIQDPNSILNLYRRLIRLRRERPSLETGGYRLIAQTDNLLAFVRELEQDRLLMVLNLTTRPATWQSRLDGCILLSSGGDREGERIHEGVSLRGNEGVIIELAAYGGR